MYLLEFDKEADLEFSDAFIWYERKREGLGVEFETAIIEALAKIAANPEHYGNRGNGFRQFVVRKFQFVIAFRVHEAGQTIFVSAIFHTSRNPAKKFRDPE